MGAGRRGVKEVVRLLVVDSLWVGAALVLSVILAVGWATFSGSGTVRETGGIVILDDGSRIQASSPEEMKAVRERFRGRVASVETSMDAFTPMIRKIGPILAAGPLLFLGVYAAWRERTGLAGAFRLGWGQVGLGVAGGAVLLGAGWAFDTAYAAFDVPLPDVEELFRMIGTPAFVLVLGAVLAPVAEELYFRWRLLNRIDPKLGTGWGTGISTALFGLAHGIPALLPAYLFFGWTLVVLRRRSGGLVAPMLAHAINNGALLGILLYGG